jgi:ABC-2 type transport system ATP-binding protein
VVHDGTLEELHRRYGSRRRVVVELEERLPVGVDLGGATPESTSPDGRLLTFSIDDAGPTAGELVARLASAASLRDLSVQEPAIDDVIARLYASRSA